MSRQYENSSRCENRRYQRRLSSAPMIFRPLDSIRFHRAVEMNNCIEGICFKSPVAIAPGTIIQIRRGQEAETGGLRPVVTGIEKSKLATAVWCDEMGGDNEYTHSCGVRYFPYDVLS